jgi:dihydrolipoamide dehydrogenase
MTSGVGTLMKGNNIDVYMGLGTVDASRTVNVAKDGGKTEQFSADKIILANGSVPLMPPMPGINGKNVMNSDTCWNLSKLPESLICVGGGVIGMELACMFDALGTKVTVLEMLPNVLAPVDDEVRRLLVRILNKRGINIVTNAKVEAIEDEGNQKVVVTTTDKGQQKFPAEYVLVAVSRRANTNGLQQLIEQGLDNDRSRIRVNEKMETNLPGIYAIGDLVHGAGLAHVASMEGEGTHGLSCDS